MKRIIALCVAVVAAAASFAVDLEDLSGLSPESRIEFDSKFLSIRFVKNPGIVWHGGVEDLEYDDWIPYQGAFEISKADFFTVAGHGDVVDTIEAEYKRVRKLHIWGGVLTALGGAAFLSGMMLIATSNEYTGEGVSQINSGKMTGGAVLSALGSAGCAFGIVLLYKKINTRNISVSFALNVADVYNRSLFDSLRAN